MPGDPSSAAFWVVAATITPGSELVLEDVALNPARIAFVDVLVRMGASIEIVATGERLGEPVGELRVTAAPLHGTTVEGAEHPVGASTRSPSSRSPPRSPTASPRSATRASCGSRRATASPPSGELLTRHRRCGSRAAPTASWCAAGAIRMPAELDSHGDHRVAMAGAIAANASEGETVVRGWRAVAISYPEFTEDLATLTGRSAP